MKKALSVLMIAVLILGSLTLTACGNQGMKFIRMKDIGSISDEKTQELIDSLSFLDKCKDDECICILTDEASGEVKIPPQYQGCDVVYVTAFPDACGDITNLVLHKYNRFLQYVFSFDSDNDTLTSVSIYDRIRHLTMSDCFNHCSALEEMDLSDGSTTMINCFNCCGALTEVNLKTVNVLSGSFNNCTGVKTVELKSEAGLDGSFNGCSALESVSIDLGESIADSFNDCTALESLTMNSEEIEGSFNRCTSLPEVNVIDSVTDSFNDASVLTSLSFAGDKATNAFNNAKKLTSLVTSATDFKDSLNECTALKTVKLTNKLKTVDGSFKDCPVNIKKIKSDEEIEEQKKKEEEERERKEREEEEKKIDNHAKDLKEIVDAAWKKLQKAGAVTIDDDGKPDIDFEESQNADGERCDQPVFGDDTYRLLSEPYLDLQNIVLLNNEYQIYELSGVDKKLYAVNFEDCRYIIVYDSYTSKSIPGYYQRKVNGVLVNFVPRVDVTTLVYIVDAKEKEIVSVHSVYTDVPSDNSPKSNKGEINDSEAGDYIKQLLS